MKLDNFSGQSRHYLATMLVWPGTVVAKHWYNWDYIFSSFTFCHVAESARWIRSLQKVKHASTSSAAAVFQHGFWWYAIRLAATLITEVTLKSNGLASAESSEAPILACALALRMAKRTLSQFPHCESHFLSAPFAPSSPRPPLSPAQCHGNAKWRRWRHTRM